MIKYIKINASADDKCMEELLALSKAWAEEHSCPAYYENEAAEFIDHDVYVAADDGRIVAYALGSIKELKEKTSYNEIGEKAFELDELYVDAGYRNRGIGRSLYKFVEADVRDRVDVIGVIAASFDHKRLLRFYVDDLDMTFNHALLVKRTRV